MEAILSKLLDVIKDQTPKFAFAGFVVSSFILFFPNQYLALTGLNAVTYRVEVAFVFLICAALLVWEIFTGIGKWNNSKRGSRNAKRRLHNLTPEEKEILCGYIEGNTRTQTLNSSNAIVYGLCQVKIIYLATPNKYALANYDIADWAWDYLKKNTYLLK